MSPPAPHDPCSSLSKPVAPRRHPEGAMKTLANLVICFRPGYIAVIVAVFARSPLPALLPGIREVAQNGYLL